MSREVMSIPLYLHLPRHAVAQQTHILVTVVVRTNDEGTVIHAVAECDEISPPYPRVGYNANNAVAFPDAAVYVPPDILAGPVYIIVEKLRGIRLKVRAGCGSNGMSC